MNNAALEALRRRLKAAVKAYPGDQAFDEDRAAVREAIAVLSAEPLIASYGNPFDVESAAPRPEFCRYCGASIPKRFGEGTCEKCDPDGMKDTPWGAPRPQEDQ